MDDNPGVPGFGMKAFFLAEKGIGKPARYQGNAQKAAQEHAGKHADQAAHNQAAGKRTDTPVNKFSFHAAVNKGLLKPLIDWITAGHYTPKKALITTDTNTRNRHDPSQDINSFEIS